MPIDTSIHKLQYYYDSIQVSGVIIENDSLDILFGQSIIPEIIVQKWSYYQRKIYDFGDLIIPDNVDRILLTLTIIELLSDGTENKQEYEFQLQRYEGHVKVWGGAFLSD